MRKSTCEGLLTPVLTRDTPMVDTPYPICSHQNLRVFQYATTLATDLFWITRRFPNEELYALTAQLRRTARSVPVQVGRGWRKRYYGPAFRQHLDEAQSACARLGLWIGVAHERCYLTDDDYETLQARKTHLQRMLTRLHDQRIALLAGGVVPALT